MTDQAARLPSALSQLIEGFESRLTLYDIDDRARNVMKETWAGVAPLLEGAKLARVTEAVGTISD